MSIERKIQERKEQIMALAQAKVRHAAVSLLSKVQLKSPVDTGAFRQAWTLTEKAPFHFTVSNDKPYALVLEYGLYPKTYRAERVNSRRIFGDYANLIEVGDQTALSTSSLELKTGSIMTIEGERYKVIDPKPIKPANKVILYKAHVRKI